MTYTARRCDQDTIWRIPINSVGDDAAIVASTLSRWNVPCTLASTPVGNDQYGRIVLKHLEDSGLDTSQRFNQESGTPLEVGIVDSTGARTYFQQRDMRDVASLPIPKSSQLSNARMLYVDWYDGARVLDAMEQAQAQGVPVFLNLESRYSDAPRLSDLLRLTTVCQVSIDEPQASGDPLDICRDLLDKGIGAVLVTMGAEGCVVAQENKAFYIRPPGVTVIDGFGAGAAFSAGMIYGLQAGWPLLRCAMFATAHAGINCGVAGNAFPAVDEVQDVARVLPVEAAEL